MDYAAQFQARKDATKNLVPQDQIDRLQVLFKKGSNMFASLFAEVDAIRRHMDNEPVFSDWCIYQLKISVGGLSAIAAVLGEGNASRIRHELAEAKKAEKERRDKEIHARQMEAQERKNALSAKKVENAERKAKEAEEAKKAKKAAAAAVRKARRADKGDAIIRACGEILRDETATREEIMLIADVPRNVYDKARAKLEAENRIGPKSQASSEDASYEQCVIKGKAAVLAEGESRWIEGDLAIIVPKKYGAQTLERFAADIGIEYSTLQGRKNVAKAWPKIFHVEVFRFVAN